MMGWREVNREAISAPVAYVHARCVSTCACVSVPTACVCVRARACMRTHVLSCMSARTRMHASMREHVCEREVGDD